MALTKKATAECPEMLVAEPEVRTADNPLPKSVSEPSVESQICCPLGSRHLSKCFMAFHFGIKLSPS